MAHRAVSRLPRPRVVLSGTPSRRGSSITCANVFEPDRQFCVKKLQMEAGNLREGDGHSRVVIDQTDEGLSTGAATAGELRAGRDRVGRAPWAICPKLIAWLDRLVTTPNESDAG